MQEKKRGSGLIPFTQGNGPTPQMIKKSAQTRSKNAKIRKTIRSQLQMMLQQECQNDQGQVMTLRQGITAALIKAAIGGNTKAFELIRDTIGEKPTDKIDVTTSEIDVMAQVSKRLDQFRNEQQTQ